MRHILTLTELTAESASWELSAGHVLSTKWKGKHRANLYCWNCVLGILQWCLGQGNCKEFSKNQKLLGLCVSAVFTHRGYIIQSRSVRNQTSPAQHLGSERLLNNSHTKLEFTPHQMNNPPHQNERWPLALATFTIYSLKMWYLFSLHLSVCIFPLVFQDDLVKISLHKERIHLMLCQKLVREGKGPSVWIFLPGFQK